MGNLIPALIWLPLASFGLWMIVETGELLGTGLWLLLAASVLGWLALNQFGYYQNARMQRQLEKILRAQEAELCMDRIFVGYASPKYSSWVDAHEDVGFLCFLPDKLRFVSETRVVEMLRSEVKNVRYRLNAHSFVGLGRWISIEGLSKGQRVRMLIEPRERNTMLSNLLRGKKLTQKIRGWLKESSPGASAGAD